MYERTRHVPKVVVIECESQLWRSNLGKNSPGTAKGVPYTSSAEEQPKSSFGAVRMPNITHGKSTVQLGPVSRARSDAFRWR